MASTLPLSIPLSIYASIYSRILHSPTHERKNKIPMSVSSVPDISCTVYCFIVKLAIVILLSQPISIPALRPGSQLLPSFSLG